MNQLATVFQRGLKHSVSPKPLIGLYLIGLLLGLVQSWPTLFIIGGDLHQPWLGEIAAGDGDAVASLFFGGDGNLGIAALSWILAGLVLSLVYAVAYNLISGGALALWSGTAGFGAGARRHFWGFTGLGAILLLLSLPALAVAVLVGSLLGTVAGTLATFGLIQLLNMFGEYTRALMVLEQRNNPALLFGRALRFCLRNPACLLPAILGIALHSAVTWFAVQSNALPTWIALLLAQCWAFAWVWIKLLRLGWAMELVGTALRDQPQASGRT